MITVYCINNKGQRFNKIFNSYHAARVFILRCMHGHSLIIEGYETYDQDCDEGLRSLLVYGF